VSPSAQRQIRKLPQRQRDRVNARLLELERDPRPQGVKKLSGEKNVYRIRIGDYRALYSIEDEILFVLVIEVGHRRDIYK
jgi:mRNA interferase RelE/StbE